MLKKLFLVSVLIFSQLASANCFVNVHQFHKQRGRGRQMEVLIQNRDLRGLKKFFWDHHDLEVMAERPKDGGLYRMLRSFNGTRWVPYLYQTKNKINKFDTLSTIFNAADDAVEYTRVEREAIDDILDWLGMAQEYRKNLNRIIEQGYEQRIQFEDMQANLRELRKIQFPGASVNVPVVVDGKVVQSPIYPESFQELKDFITDNIRKHSRSFAQHWVDEMAKKGAIHNEQIEYAVMYRRLELIYQKLSLTPEAKLSSDQQGLREMLQGFLHSNAFNPRAYAYDHVRRKEFWAEFWASMRLRKSQRIANDAKYQMPTKVLETVSKVTPIGAFFRFAAIGTVGLAAITTPFMIFYEDNPIVQYVTSTIKNYWNDFLVLTLGWPSGPLADCYKSERPWTTEEGSAMNTFVESHLSRFTAMSRIDPSYNPETDEEMPADWYIKRKLKLQALCAKERLEYQAARRHVENKELLSQHGYRFAAHLALIELIEQEALTSGKSKDEARELAGDLYQYFEESEVFEQNEKAEEILLSIKDQKGQEFVEQLVSYQENIKQTVEAIRQGNFNLYAPSSDAYFEKVRLWEAD